MYRIGSVELIIGAILAFAGFGLLIFGALKRKMLVLIIALIMMIISFIVVIGSASCVGWGCSGIPDVIIFR